MNSTLKDGTAKEVEFELRPIDANGDCIDPQHFETKEEALKASLTAIGGDCVAWVVERHTSYHPAWHAPRGQNPDNYLTIATGGDLSALSAGGWIK